MPSQPRPRSRSKRRGKLAQLQQQLGITRARHNAARAAASARSPSPRPSSRPSRPGSRSIRSPAASGSSTSSRCSCAWAATAMRSLSPPRRGRAPARAPLMPRGRRRRTAGASHALRPYWATHLLEAGVPVPRGLRAARTRRPQDHRPLRRARPERVDQVAEVLDRRHHAARRAGWGACSLRSTRTWDMPSRSGHMLLGAPNRRVIFTARWGRFGSATWRMDRGAVGRQPAEARRSGRDCRSA